MIRFKHVIRKHLILALLPFLIVGLAACNNEEDDLVVEPVEVAYVTLYHASPNAPDFQVTVDNQHVNQYPFGYTDYTGYLRFYTGDRNFRFLPYDANNVVLDTLANLENGKAYSVFLGGEYPEIQTLIVNDNAPAPSVGMSNFRVVNLSPDVGQVSTKLAGDSVALFEKNGFMDITDFKEINAASTDLELTNPSGDKVILDLPDLNFLEGGYYTLIIRGYQTPPTGSEKHLSAQLVLN